MKKIILFLNIFIVLLFSGCIKNDATNIGIIGGADGPTAIFLAITLRPYIIFLAILLIAIIIGILIYKKRNKK